MCDMGLGSVFFFVMGIIFFWIGNSMESFIVAVACIVTACVFAVGATLLKELDKIRATQLSMFLMLDRMQASDMKTKYKYDVTV